MEEPSGTAGVKSRWKVLSCSFVASNNDSVTVSSEFCIQTAVELDFLTALLFVMEFRTFEEASPIRWVHLIIFMSRDNGIRVVLRKKMGTV